MKAGNAIYLYWSLLLKQNKQYPVRGYHGNQKPILYISEAIERALSANYAIMMDGNEILSLKDTFIHVQSNPEKNWQKCSWSTNLIIMCMFEHLSTK